MAVERRSIERHLPVSIHFPRWFYGGDPRGLADYCGWQLELEDETAWRWKVQTVETVSGERPDLIQARFLSKSGAPQSEALYDPLMQLASRDALQPGGLWAASLAQDASFAESDQRTFATTLYNVRNLIMAAPSAAELRAIMPWLVENRIHPVLPRSTVWFIETPHDWLATRYGLARALLRREETLTLGDDAGSVFQGSRLLFDDATLGLGSYITPLFTSLAPHFWGFSAFRVGGLVALDFGEFINGDSPSSDRVLSRFVIRARTRQGAEEPPTLKSSAFGATLRWWCARLNLLFAQATNLANYVSRGGEWSPAMYMEKLLSLEQFFRHCESLATARDDPHSRRVMLFMALETLGGIAPSLGWTVTYDFEAVEKMLARLKCVLPDSVQKILLPRAEKAVESMRSVLDGFFVSSRRDESGNIRVTDDKGVVRPVPPHVAVRLWLRVLRNSHHGFDKDQSRQTRDLLAIHDGSFPDALPDLAWFFLVYILAFPEVVRRAKPAS